MKLLSSNIPIRKQSSEQEASQVHSDNFHLLVSYGEKVWYIWCLLTLQDTNAEIDKSLTHVQAFQVGTNGMQLQVASVKHRPVLSVWFAVKFLR